MWANPLGFIFLSLAVAIGVPVVTSLAPEFLLPVAAFFVLCGIMSFMWVPILKVTGPHLYKDHLAINHWRIKAHNEGPAAAANVQMYLLDITPRPRYHPWGADYPYPVQLVATIGNPQFSCRIHQNHDAAFEIVSGWPNADGEFYTRGLDTRANDNPIRIENDERWILTYEIVADNAKTKSLSLEMSVDVASRAIMVQRKS